ncbi:MAG TPA: hypothetical protein VKU02_00365 [Gemmataceae bacterium]|nr:hypothetical protein [Gemmataceae bacterium]
MTAAARTSLNVHLDWTLLAPLLDLPQHEQALPARNPCPLCLGGRLTVYPDPRDGGAWFACRDCQKAGDLIELAAAVWGMSLTATVNRLVRLGAPLPAQAVTTQAVDAYVRDYPAYRQRFLNLWTQAQQALPPRTLRPAINALLHRLHLVSRLGRERWQQGPGQLLGVLPKEAVEACFCPGSTGQGGAGAKQRYQLNPSGGRVFSGPGWSDVLAVPYADLPGRFCAWQFIGRQAAAADRVFRPLRLLTRSGSNQYQRQPPLYAEAGLAGLSTVESAALYWGGAVFAVDDVVLALRLQLRHFVSNLRPLPLVSWYDGPRARTQQAWQALAGHPVIFWCDQLQPAVLWQARQADGLLIVAGPELSTRRAWDHYLRLWDPLHLLRQLRRRAVPWREALRRWVDKQPDGAVRELLLGLEAYAVDVRQLVQECGGGRLAELVPEQARLRSIRFGNRTIVERGDRWFVAGRRGAETLLLDAVVRVDRLRLLEEELEYVGRILFRGEEVPFAAAESAWERQPARWLRRYLVEQGKGVLQFAPGVRDLLEIALRFQEPMVD